MMTISDLEGWIFLSHLILSLVHHLIHHLLTKKLEKDFKKILNTLRCDMMTSFSHNNDVNNRRATSVQLFGFLSFPRACTGVWDRNISQG